MSANAEPWSENLKSLLSMGFTRPESVEALFVTGADSSSQLEKATEYLVLPDETKRIRYQEVARSERSRCYFGSSSDPALLALVRWNAKKKKKKEEN